MASGLAGFLIVEGDVDEAINRAMTGNDDPCVKTGPNDYRERLMLIQRVEVFFRRRGCRQGAAARSRRLPRSTFSPTTMLMRPGAVERWRVLNASVDGRGFKSFMARGAVRLLRPPAVAGAPSGKARRAATVRAGDAAGRRRRDGSCFSYRSTASRWSKSRTAARATIRDLARQNAGTRNPIDRRPAEGEGPTRAMLKNEDCYRDGDSLRRLFLRPNQVFLANANRADVLFKAPLDAAGKVYTVFAQESPLATDNFQQRLQSASRTSLGSIQQTRRRRTSSSAISRLRRRRAGRRLRRDDAARQAASGAIVPPARRG